MLIFYTHSIVGAINFIIYNAILIGSFLVELQRAHIAAIVVLLVLYVRISTSIVRPFNALLCYRFISRRDECKQATITHDSIRFQSEHRRVKSDLRLIKHDLSKRVCVCVTM